MFCSFSLIVGEIGDSFDVIGMKVDFEERRL